MTTSEFSECNFKPYAFKAIGNIFGENIIKMNVFSLFVKQARGLFLVFILFLIPFGFLFYYTSINVETALLQRKVKRLEHEKELYMKKNNTLRETIIRESRIRSGKVDEPEPDFLRNKIVRIRLDEESIPGEKH